MGGDRQSARPELHELLRLGHLSTGERLGDALVRAGRKLEVEIAAYLVDYEQRRLVPLPAAGARSAASLDVETTRAGEAFRLLEQVRDDQDATRLWVPLVDGVERIGVLEVEGRAHDLGDPELQDRLRWLSALFGHFVGSKRAFSDSLEILRRSEAMSVGGELLWRLLPPLTFGTEGIVVAAVLYPSYDVGGDCFDYGVQEGFARVCILDSMGHAVQAGLISALAIAAYRSSYRAGGRLAETVGLVDRSLREEFAGERFATGVLGELDLRTGRFRYMNAGHPAPLLRRRGRVVGSLDGARRLPLGVEDADVAIAEAALEPGDQLLFYTDGVTEARGEDGSRFGLPRLIEMLDRAAGRGRAPEALRLLGVAVSDYQGGRFDDDATLLLVEWRTGEEQDLNPRPEVETGRA